MDKNEELVLISSLGIIAVIGIAYLMNRKPTSEGAITPTTSETQTISQTQSSMPPTTNTDNVVPVYSNSPGSQSNPYLFDNGYQGAGYYLFTSQEFSKLASIPASGIKVNPTYMDNLAFYQSVKYWLNYTPTSTTIQYTPPSTATSPSTNGMTISVSPSAISLTQGATITISGSGFPPYSKGYISANNIEVAGFTADSNGNFDVSASYYFNQNQVSGLGNAIKDASGNFIDLVAYDYQNGMYSNKATLYFA